MRTAAWKDVLRFGYRTGGQVYGCALLHGDGGQHGGVSMVGCGVMAWVLGWVVGWLWCMCAGALLYNLWP
jgi:hypothetical protein